MSRYKLRCWGCDIPALGMSSDRLKQVKERSKLRRQLLAQQLGVEEQDFSSILGTKEDRGSASPNKATNGGAAGGGGGEGSEGNGLQSSGSESPLPSSSEEKKRKEDDSVSEESSVYKDSKTFLKGTHR